MMKLHYSIIIIVIGVFFICCCTKQGNKTHSKTTEKGGWESYETGLKNLSGLCYNKNGTTLLGAIDKGSVFEIDFRGNVLRKLPLQQSGDFEAITMNYKNGAIYLADEGLMTIFQLSSNEEKLFEIVELSIPNSMVNKGLEGLAYGLDTLYIANQTSPTRLFKYCLSSKEIFFQDVSFATYLSDVCFDDTDNSLWFVDSKKQMIFHCTLNAEVIASQNIPMVKKAEALFIDRKNYTAWVGCDDTGLLYKINLII